MNNKKELEDRLSNISHITSIDINDKSLYKKFFMADNKERYSNSWLYIIQASRGIGSNNIGMKFFDDNNLISFGIHNNHLVVVRPMGDDVVNILKQLVPNLYALSNLPVYLKKVDEYDAEQLLNQPQFKPIYDYPWDKIEIACDDTFPEQMVDLELMFEIDKLRGTKWKNLREDLSRFRHRGKEMVLKEYNINMKNMILRYIKSWASGDMIKYTAYAPLLNNFSPDESLDDYFIYYIIHENKISGFYIIEKMTNESVSAIAGFTDKKTALASTSWFEIYKKMFYDYKTKRVHLGGSEYEGQHRFKRKFNTIDINNTNFLVFLPD